MMARRMTAFSVAACGWILSFPAPAQPASGPAAITLASTTSTEQSGLFAHLLPAFRQETGIDVRVVAVGTGQAIDLARRGDADALLVHDTAAEEKLVTEGVALRRYPVMYNDFILVGPASDPASARGKDVASALLRIAGASAAFISRGDRSGTHAAELRYWSLAGVKENRGGAYRACGCGMGSALNIASATGAYILTDRGTWLSFRNRADLAVLVEGDPRMFNPYGALVVNPARHPHVRAAQAQRFVDWLVSASGQARIAAYRIGGQPLFFPSAVRP